MQGEGGVVLTRYVLDDAGEPVPEPDLMTWARWFETADRIVARTILSLAGTDVRVSTVFLGLDYNSGAGPPLIYETMIFGGHHDEYQARYATRAEALAGHAAAVRLVEQGAEVQT
jgi:hypothetical protein